MILRPDLTLLNINMSKNPLPHDFSCQKVCIINDYLYLIVLNQTIKTHFVYKKRKNMR